ncbi:hypothetical protein KCTC52924_00470 [Arenibacter antarcticus]|uniref:Molybdopterin-binding protein n=1 Tax=Arenibacter antarcticus TaxID=2040469 RepID=A0ABW5VBE7_9FLAO|nr:TOBE domain-containing protein [Arenibacter sp. H213]MCM4169435.1 tobe domain protein [Arenibacter sp. H213]
MNSFQGNISKIKTKGNLSLVTITLGNQVDWVSVVLDTPSTAPYMILGNEVKVLFKETEVILGIQQRNQISVENCIEGILKSIERGEILSRLVVTTAIGELVAVVGSNSVERLELVANQDVTALVKMNEIILAP